MILFSSKAVEVQLADQKCPDVEIRYLRQQIARPSVAPAMHPEPRLFL